MPREVWYIMEDGSMGNPREVAHDAQGVLRHKDGRAVAMAPHGPRSRSVDPDAERAGAKKDEKDAKPTATRELKAEEPKRGYKTRDAKAG